MRWWLLVVALASACVHSDSVNCGDRTCPQGSTCDNVHTLCVSKDQAGDCAQRADGDACSAADINATGVCDQGFCVPGCGDGVTQDPNAVGLVEECDDGNFQSHDGCSSTCVAETPVWLERIDQWRGRYGFASAYMANLDKLVMLTGIDQIQGFPDDQWERDGAGKWTRIANTPVGQRYGAAIAYDDAHDVIVLFGGYGPNKAPLGDTWEYDGTTWTKKQITGGPTARGGAAMVWDSTRSKIVMFGGQTAVANTNSAEVWEYNGTAWTPVTTTGAIPGRHLHTMAYDSARQRIVVFAGITDTASPFDTWEFAPATATWTQNLSATHPSRRYLASMAFQASRGKVVLFGGQTTANGGVIFTIGDAWEYDAAGWVELTTPVRPPGRYGATLTAIAGGALALVSGATGTDIVPQTDAWVLTSTGAWSDISPEFPPRREGAMAYDKKHDALTMFSGNVVVGADTWTFDGLRWNDVTPTTTTNPSARFLNGVAYDAKRDRVVMFGGAAGSTFFDDTWEWGGDAKTWTPYTGTTKPPARNFVHLAYDDNAGVSVLFGGNGNGGALSDTWEYDGTTWLDRTSGAGTPPKIGNFTMAYDPDHKRIVAFDDGDRTFAYENHRWQQLTTVGDVPMAGPMILLPSIAHDPERHVMTLYDGNTSRLWELDGDTWTRVRVIGTVPPPRYLPGFTEHLGARRLILFGGGAAAGAIGDTWYFGYRSEALDELCSDGMDNDNDKHIDAADPDCENQ